MSSWLPSRVLQTCIPMRATQPLSHLPSQYKANLIFPQGPRDDASLLQAFCRLNTASLEWIRRFQESNYQLANPELVQTRSMNSNTQEEVVYNCVALSMKGVWSFAGGDGWRGVVIHIKYDDIFWKRVYKKSPDTVTGRSRALLFV